MADVKEVIQGQDDEISLLDIVITVKKNILLLTVFPLISGLCALGISFFIKPTFTAETTFLPPQQQSGLAHWVGWLVLPVD